MTGNSVRTPRTPSQQDLSLRRATDADWDDIITADARAFAMRNPLPADERADLREKVDDADVVLIRDESRSPAPLVGVSMFYRMTMTVPGGAVRNAAALSWVSVAATHRRRGILRRMLTELFDQWESEGQIFGILTASEGTIYERFGFGPACFAHAVRIVPAHARFRAESPAAATVRYADAETVAAAVPDLHARWTRTTPGALGRTPAWWRPILADRRSERPFAASGQHYLLHDDGYAAYRIVRLDTGEVHADVTEVFAATDDAHTDLWRVLSSLDLVPLVTASIPVDDPLPAKLTDLRAVEVTGLADKMWLCILDIPAALGARQFAADLEVVIEVTDEFRDRGGVFDVAVRDGGAIVAPSSAAPSARMDIAVLGSIYLGGIRPSTFAAAGRLWTATPEVLTALDQAFTTPRAPFSGTFF